jgi:prophage DNA circulation protein
MTPLWKMRLRPASFNGIPFSVESHEFRTGRNIVAHEYPNTNAVFTEDTGKRVDIFSITGYVVGDNYFAIRDALLSASRLAKASILIHPFLGAKNVMVGQVTMAESLDEGGIAKFTFQFYEVGPAGFPSSFFDEMTGLFDSATLAVARAKLIFEEVFNVVRLPSFAVQGCISVLTDFGGLVASVTGGIRSLPDEAAKIGKGLQTLVSTAASLVRDPKELARQTDETMALLKGLPAPKSASQLSLTFDSAGGRDDSVDVFRPLCEFDSGASGIPDNTPIRRQQRESQLALEALIRQLAIVRMTEQSAAKLYRSTDDADKARETLTGYIDRELSLTTSDEIYQAFADLKHRMLEAIPNPRSNVASIRRVERLSDTPSVVLAYQLYGSRAGEQDILDRNAVRNPAFVAGSLEVLND